MRVYCNDCKTFCYFNASSEYPTWVCPKCKNKVMLKKFEGGKTEIICIDKFGYEYTIQTTEPSIPIYETGTTPILIKSETEVPCNFELVFEE